MSGYGSSGVKDSSFFFKKKENKMNSAESPPYHPRVARIGLPAPEA